MPLVMLFTAFVAIGTPPRDGSFGTRSTILTRYVDPDRRIVGGSGGGV